MLRYNIQAFTKDHLNAESTPELYGQPEFVPWGFYDTRDMTTGFSALSFYAATSNDIAVTNLQNPNTMPANNYFRPFAYTLDWLITATSNTSSGATPIVDDLLAIQARCIFQFNISNKLYIQVPISALHASGGVYVSYQLGTPTGSGLGNFGMNWMPDGGYWTNGAWVLSPLNNFTCQVIAGTTTPTLVATRSARVTMWGPLARRVL